MISKFFNPKNDVAFKRLFGTERNKDILISFLNDVLPNKKVIDVQFLNTIQDVEAAALKQSIVDVLCTDQDKSHYIIEMQVAHYKDFIKRAQFYAAKAYTRQLKIGEEYDKLKEVIFIAITDFIMFPDKPGYKSDHVVLDGESYTRNLTDFSFTFIELPKFKKSEHELKSTLDKWCYFFINTPNDNSVENTFAKDATLTKCLHELEVFGWDDEELALYERAEKNERDYISIMNSKKEEGRQEERVEIAKNFKQLGISLQDIAKATGLAVSDIEKL